MAKALRFLIFGLLFMASCFEMYTYSFKNAEQRVSIQGVLDQHKEFENQYFFYGNELKTNNLEVLKFCKKSEILIVYNKVKQRENEIKYLGNEDIYEGLQKYYSIVKIADPNFEQTYILKLPFNYFGKKWRWDKDVYQKNDLIDFYLGPSFVFIEDDCISSSRIDNYSFSKKSEKQIKNEFLDKDGYFIKFLASDNSKLPSLTESHVPYTAEEEFRKYFIYYCLKLGFSVYSDRIGIKCEL